MSHKLLRNSKEYEDTLNEAKGLIDEAMATLKHANTICPITHKPTVFAVNKSLKECYGILDDCCDND